MYFYKEIKKFFPINNDFIKVYKTLPDVTKLKNEIDNFNNEIEWALMWSIEDAQKRLNNNWIIITLEIENKIQGWVWLDTINNFLQNLYVNKIYRNKGYATDLVHILCNVAKKNNINQLKTHVEDWNLPSQRVFIKCGWEKIDD